MEGRDPFGPGIQQGWGPELNQGAGPGVADRTPGRGRRGDGPEAPDPGASGGARDSGPGKILPARYSHVVALPPGRRRD